MRVGAVDCGTNTIKLMVMDLPSGEVLVRETRMVRLGQGVDRTGRLAPEALERAFAALDEYAALLDEHPVDRLRFCATSAARDASNGEVFAAGVRARLGVDPEVVAGDEEARLAYAGAVGHLATPPQHPVLVVDIGGGSTELILGRLHGGRDSAVDPAVEPAVDPAVDQGPDEAHSMDIGSVRLHERHLHDDPPTAEQVAAATADIEEALDASPVPVHEAATVVGVAGTVLTVAAGVLDLPAYDRDALDQAVLSVEAVHATTARLLAMTVEERRALPYMHPGRADVIGAGALVLDRVLRRTAATDLVVSEADILDGIAWSLTESSEGRASDRGD